VLAGERTSNFPDLFRRAATFVDKAHVVHSASVAVTMDNELLYAKIATMARSNRAAADAIAVTLRRSDPKLLGRLPYPTIAVSF